MELQARENLLRLSLVVLRRQLGAAERRLHAGQPPQVATHQHRRVALVGLTRHVAERPRAPGHLARLCIHAAARRRSPSRRNRYARRRWSSTWRPTGGPPWSARRTATTRPRLRARMHRPHRQRLTAALNSRGVTMKSTASSAPAHPVERLEARRGGGGEGFNEVSGGQLGGPAL